MKMKAPRGVPFVHLSLTTGHTFAIGPDPVEVPRKFLAQAIERGAEEAPDGAPAADQPTSIQPSEPAAPPESKQDVICNAIVKMIEAKTPGDFLNDGRPAVEPLSKMAGFQVTAGERDSAWAVVQKAMQT